MSNAISVDVDVRRVQRRTLSVLMVSQALGGVGVSSGIAVATLRYKGRDFGFVINGTATIRVERFGVTQP